MTFSVDQVLALAPDASAATAGRKLASGAAWQNLGRSAGALWGECRGSALYQVRVDLADLTVSCSCPSRKFPCKHGLGLLLLAANGTVTIPEAEPPAWVTAWLEKRATRTAKQGEALTAPPPRTKRAAPVKEDQRLARVCAGLDALDLWLADLMRNGLATVETRPAAFWEAQAARMVDAQAPGIAARLRRMAAIPLATPDWPRRLLGELGKLALLSHAVRRLDALPVPLAADVRALVGWTAKTEEIAATVSPVTDAWHILGQRITTERHLRQQATWLVGETTGCAALILTYAAGGAPFAESFVPGIVLRADLAFWPSADPLRALVKARHGTATTAAVFPGARGIAAHLEGVAAAIACQPWLDRFPCTLRSVVPIPNTDGPWYVRDATGDALPLSRGDHWLLLALSGGAPVDLFGEWDGDVVTPLGVMADGAYHPLTTWEAR